MAWILDGSWIQSSTQKIYVLRWPNKARVNEEKFCNVLNILNPLSE